MAVAPQGTFGFHEGTHMRERKLVLLIEDNPTESEMYGKLLWYNGFDVAFADTGAEGLRLIDEVHPDLVVTDLGLPDIDGFDVCRQLKSNEATANTPVVALSGRAKEHSGERALLEGCVEYFEKPISPYEVLKGIERLIGQQPPGEPNGGTAA
jgi:CheY-like chemotaxis protein